MSLAATKNIRDYLCDDPTITSLVSTSNIRVGWPNELDAFPTILITQSAGMDIGYLGYRTSAAGSRVRREEVNIQIDIFSQTSRRETLQIADAIVPVMIASGAARKISDIDMYDDNLKSYRKMQTYSFTMFHDD